MNTNKNWKWERKKIFLIYVSCLLVNFFPLVSYRVSSLCVCLRDQCCSHFVEVAVVAIIIIVFFFFTSVPIVIEMEVLYLGLPFFSCEKRKKRKNIRKQRKKKKRNFVMIIVVSLVVFVINDYYTRSQWMQSTRIRQRIIFA